MKEIPLTKGRFAMVDDEDYEWLSGFRWQANFTGRRWYARRSFRAAGHQFHLYLHRVIMDVGDPTLEVDHANGDGLDCRKYNMRVATKSQNKGNTGLRPGSRTGYKGVSFRSDKWYATVGARLIGKFDSAVDAARAYDAAAVEYYGEFAQTNASLGLVACSTLTAQAEAR